ncbi:MAG: trypsin-like peptidase domain-containing protein [Gemmatimonadota bacterium]|nr:trypsin-like peptidase domain-containing protein [Gemmatimonadota bacterium]
MRIRGTIHGVAFAAGAGVGVGAAAVVIGREAVHPAWAQQAQPQQGRGTEEQNVIRVARQVSPAVVSVSRSGGSGSGVIIRRDGVVLTNAHVVGNARTVQVGLADGRRLNGTVAGRDQTLDIAVVRIPITDAPVAPLGDSDRLEVGQAAIAIGNPLGLERTVTTGVVSAVNRSPRGIQLDGLIQTDAAISVGNSGGPLLDSNGRVIGINTAIIGGPGVAGLGFAVPINLAADITQQVLTDGRIRRAFIGIQYGDIEPELAQQFGLPVREGIIVLQVSAGSPAGRAGIRPQDIITRMNDVPIARGGDLRRLLRDLSPGDTVTFAVRRPGGQTTVRLTLAEADE